MMEKAMVHNTMNKDLEAMTGCRCPGGCFCKYDVGDLVHIAYKKFIEKVPTVDLIHSAHSAKEVELVSVVALLDLKASDADIMIKEHMSDSSCDVLACRNALRSKLDVALKSYSPNGDRQ